MDLQQVKTDLENGVLISPCTWLRVLEAALELKGARGQLVAALSDVKQRIENSDEWWMDMPDRGGFDLEAINTALATAAATES